MGADLSIRIASLCQAIMAADHEDIETSIDAALDMLSEGHDRSDTLVAESILDGLRWGFRAAATVELGGGTMVRIRVPGGAGITHEWLDRPSPKQIARIIETIEQAIGDEE